MRDSTWQHPWLGIERLLREIITRRMTRGATRILDQALAVAVEKRRTVERAGWFN